MSAQNRKRKRSAEGSPPRTSERSELQKSAQRALGVAEVPTEPVGNLYKETVGRVEEIRANPEAQLDRVEERVEAAVLQMAVGTHERAFMDALRLFGKKFAGGVGLTEADFWVDGVVGAEALVRLILKRLRDQGLLERAREAKAKADAEKAAEAAREKERAERTKRRLRFRGAASSSGKTGRVYVFEPSMAGLDGKIKMRLHTEAGESEPEVQTQDGNPVRIKNNESVDVLSDDPQNVGDQVWRRVKFGEYEGWVMWEEAGKDYFAEEGAAASAGLPIEEPIGYNIATTRGQIQNPQSRQNFTTQVALPMVYAANRAVVAARAMADARATQTQQQLNMDQTFEEVLGNFVNRILNGLAITINNRVYSSAEGVYNEIVNSLKNDTAVIQRLGYTNDRPASILASTIRDMAVPYYDYFVNRVKDESDYKNRILNELRTDTQNNTHAFGSEARRLFNLAKQSADAAILEGTGLGADEQTLATLSARLRNAANRAFPNQAQQQQLSNMNILEVLTRYTKREQGNAQAVASLQKNVTTLRRRNDVLMKKEKALNEQVRNLAQDIGIVLQQDPEQTAASSSGMSDDPEGSLDTTAILNKIKEELRRRKQEDESAAPMEDDPRIQELQAQIQQLNQDRANLQQDLAASRQQLAQTLGSGANESEPEDVPDDDFDSEEAAQSMPAPAELTALSNKLDTLQATLGQATLPAGAGQTLTDLGTTARSLAGLLERLLIAVERGDVTEARNTGRRARAQASTASQQADIATRQLQGMRDDPPGDDPVDRLRVQKAKLDILRAQRELANVAGSPGPGQAASSSSSSSSAQPTPLDRLRVQEQALKVAKQRAELESALREQQEDRQPAHPALARPSAFDRLKLRQLMAEVRLTEERARRAELEDQRQQQAVPGSSAQDAAQANRLAAQRAQIAAKRDQLQLEMEQYKFAQEQQKQQQAQQQSQAGPDRAKLVAAQREQLALKREQLKLAMEQYEFEQKRLAQERGPARQTSEEAARLAFERQKRRLELQKMAIEMRVAERKAQLALAGPTPQERQAAARAAREGELKLRRDLLAMQTEQMRAITARQESKRAGAFEDQRLELERQKLLLAHAQAANELQRVEALDPKLQAELETARMNAQTDLARSNMLTAQAKLQELRDLEGFKQQQAAQQVERLAWQNAQERLKLQNAQDARRAKGPSEDEMRVLSDLLRLKGGRGQFRRLLDGVHVGALWDPLMLQHFVTDTFFSVMADVLSNVNRLSGLRPLQMRDAIVDAALQDQIMRLFVARYNNVRRASNSVGTTTGWEASGLMAGHALDGFLR